MEHARLDQVQLLSEIRDAQAHLVEIADRPAPGDPAPPTAPTLEQFLSGLRTAWQDGEICPMRRPKEKAKRGRRRSDPFVAVTAQMREWFEAEPWRTSHELFERLQNEQPASFPSGKIRDTTAAGEGLRTTLVFGTAATDAKSADDAATGAIS